MFWRWRLEIEQAVCLVSVSKWGALRNSFFLVLQLWWRQLFGYGDFKEKKLFFDLCIRSCVRKLSLDFCFVLNSFVLFLLDLESTSNGHMHGKVTSDLEKEKDTKKKKKKRANFWCSWFSKVKVGDCIRKISVCNLNFICTIQPFIKKTWKMYKYMYNTYIIYFDYEEHVFYCMGSFFSFFHALDRFLFCFNMRRD